MTTTVMTQLHKHNTDTSGNSFIHFSFIHSFSHSFVTSHSNTNTARGGVSVTRVTQTRTCSPLRKKRSAGPGRGFRSASLRPLRPGCRLPPVLPLLLRGPWTAGAERGPHFVRVGRFWSILRSYPCTPGEDLRDDVDTTAVVAVPEYGIAGMVISPRRASRWILVTMRLC